MQNNSAASCHSLCYIYSGLAGLCHSAHHILSHHIFSSLLHAPMNTVSFVPQPNSTIASPWLFVTSSSYSHYCDSDTEVQVIDGAERVREAVTHPLVLSPSDVITFQISVGCKVSSVGDQPVLLQYSQDSGHTWHLLHPGCPAAAVHCEGPSEPSVYHPGHHGPWSRFLIPLDHRLSQRQIQLRWLQNNLSGTAGNEFALRDLYIGPPCRHNCHGHGLCTAAGHCKCDPGYKGRSAVSKE
ncbi:Reelin [Portunus trituberculatus]|uniref:Reelin n=1 Tax=Portunus trituberculatus TaxID=210409 RepID=A0A5B7HRN4_PORTR|nr:Reelin [Portunus trituberculatus]